MNVVQKGFSLEGLKVPQNNSLKNKMNHDDEWNELGIIDASIIAYNMLSFFSLVNLTRSIARSVTLIRCRYHRSGQDHQVAREKGIDSGGSSII